MAHEHSLAFRLLDAHVIAGRADEVAYADAEGSLTYAALLHEVASVAGGLVQLGVTAGSAVKLEVSGRTEVLSILAIIRIEAEVADSAEVSIAGEPAVVTTPDAEVPWDVLVQIGRVDPLPAARHDADGYADAALAQHQALLAPLLAGEAVRA